MCSRRFLATASALTLVLGSIGAPEAFAGPSEHPSPRAGARIVRVDDRSGFDWADAGIGAAGGVALSVLGVGLVLLASERRGVRR